MLIKTRATKTVKVLNNEIIYEMVNQSITVSFDEPASLSDLDVAQDKIVRALTRLDCCEGNNNN